MENEIKVFTGFDLYPDRKTVFRLIDCAEDSPVYEEALDIYDELLPVMRKAVQPRAALRFGLAPKITAAADNRALRGGRILPEGTKVLYGIHTIGEEAPKIASAAFAEGDYLKGMIADAMADGFLFALDEPMRKIAVEEAKKLGYGISRRCVAPTEIPMIYQKTAYDALSAHESIGVTLTSGLMFSPVKSCCMVYLLSDDTEEAHPEKNCDLCAKKDCPIIERRATQGYCKNGSF